MPRIRTIKPDFFSNEGMSTVSSEAQILAAGLLCMADDEGYFNANPGLVKAAVFPLRELTETFPGMFSELSGIGYVRFGTTKDGKRWGHIVKFCDHQKISHPSPSKIKDLEIAWEDSSNPLEASVKPPPSLRPERKGKERKGSKPRPSKTDVRFKEFVDVLDKYWKYKNPDIEFSFSQADGQQLNAFLSDHPGITVEKFKTCLHNRSKSEMVHTQAVHRWIGRTLEFFEGPLDQFWKRRDVKNASPPATKGRDAAAELDAQLGAKPQ